MTVAPQDLKPRALVSGASFNRGDRVFNRVITLAAFTALFVLAGITVFLGYQFIPVVQEQGLFFFTGSAWDPAAGRYGIWAMVYGSILLSVIALIVAVPASLLLSIFMVFLAPRRVSAVLTNLVDLMAAIPSIILGLWGFWVFQQVAADWSELLNRYFGWIPLFQNSSGNFTGTPFIAGLVLAVMMIPITTSVTREVMARTPPELINAAESLGCSLYSMLRHVALPFGRGGLIGGVMLGLGRALGETVAVFFVIKLVFDVNLFRILESEGGSVASMIVAKFGEANDQELQVLLAAGFVLFVGTLIVNLIANAIVGRTGRLSS